MTAPEQLQKAGAQTPAFLPSGSAPDWQVELWPNRSLTRKGASRFLLMLGGCFAFFGAMTVFAPAYQGNPSVQLRVFAVICIAMAIVLTGMWLAFRRNALDGRYRERLSILGGNLIIEADHPRRAPRRWQFPTYWTRVRTRHHAGDGEPAHPLPFRHRRCHRGLPDAGRAAVTRRRNPRRAGAVRLICRTSSPIAAARLPEHRLASTSVPAAT